MPSILRLISGMLATLVAGVTTHAAAAGSFTRGCAARDLQILFIIEEQEHRNDYRRQDQ